MLLALALSACAPDSTSTEINEALDEASARYDIDRDLLAAVGWSLSRLDQRDGEENAQHGVGVMNLKVDGSFPAIDEASRLSGESTDDIENDLTANILAGAAVLRQLADEDGERTGEPVDTLEEWYPVIAAYSGATDPLVAEGFASQVYDVLQYGMVVQSDAGETIEVAAQNLAWRQMDIRGSSLIAQFVPASSSNYTDDNRSSVDRIVIHTTEGSYSGAISWCQNSSSQVSAHYVVRSSDGQITQMVQEEDIAWHAGDWDTNKRSIGIEHEGYVSDPGKWYTDSMYRQSAALVADICDRYGIPKDRTHIIGHYEVPGCSGGSGGGSSCHTDPGSGWDWDYYMSLVTGSGSGSSSMGGRGLPDGNFHGHFDGTVKAASYGETDTCSGDLEGAANGGNLYLNGTCTLKNNPNASGNMPVTWSGTVSGDTITGTMVADGRSVSWSGKLAKDGSITANFSGSKDVGGTTGVLEYSVALTAAP
jgi:N-acetyl-anhydromuramyl-L-alanine amidase AmpD